MRSASPPANLGTASTLCHTHAVAWPHKSVLCSIHTIGIHDNFFDLGGHSLLAAKLAGMIGEQFNRELSVAAIFQASTIAQQAAVLHQATEQEPTLIPLSSGEDGSPLFCFPAAGGDILSYLELGIALDKSTTLVGVRPMSCLNQDDHASLAEIAEECAALMRTKQARGPYRLLGWSMGGFIAHQVAAILEKTGEQVEFLGIIDASQPADDLQINRVQTITGLMHIVGSKFWNLDQKTRETLVHLIGQTPRSSAIKQTIEWAYARELIEGEIPSVESIHSKLSLVEHHCRIVQGHVMERVDAPLMILWSRKTIQAKGKLPIDWTAYTKSRINTTEILAGDHYSIIKAPYNKRIIERVKEK